MGPQRASRVSARARLSSPKIGVLAAGASLAAAQAAGGACPAHMSVCAMRSASAPASQRWLLSPPKEPFSRDEKDSSCSATVCCRGAQCAVWGGHGGGCEFTHEGADVCGTQRREASGAAPRLDELLDVRPEGVAELGLPLGAAGAAVEPREDVLQLLRADGLRHALQEPVAHAGGLLRALPDDVLEEERVELVHAEAAAGVRGDAEHRGGLHHAAVWAGAGAGRWR